MKCFCDWYNSDDCGVWVDEDSARKAWNACAYEYDARIKELAAIKECLNTDVNELREERSALYKQVQEIYELAHDQDSCVFHRIEAIERIASEARERVEDKELPDSEGWWWNWFESEKYWHPRYVIQNDVDTGFHCKGKWVKATPPQISQ